MCHDNGSRQETTRLHAISCTKTGWSSLTHNRVLHQALPRSLRESKVQFVVEDVWPFRERASRQNGRLNPLWTTQRRRGHSSTTTLLLNITIVNLCAGSNLGNTARHVGTTEAGALFDNHASTQHYHRQPLRWLQSGEYSTPCRKTLRRRSR